MSDRKIPFVEEVATAIFVRACQSIVATEEKPDPRKLGDLAARSLEVGQSHADELCRAFDHIWDLTGYEESQSRDRGAQSGAPRKVWTCLRCGLRTFDGERDRPRTMMTSPGR